MLNTAYDWWSRLSDVFSFVYGSDQQVVRSEGKGYPLSIENTHSHLGSNEEKEN